MLQSRLMRYRQSLLLHREDAPFGLLLRVITLIVPASLLGLGAYLLSIGETEGGAVVLGETAIVAVIFLFVFPRRYEVYEDHLRIALGGPFGFNIGFDRIERIEVTRQASFTINFATRITRTYVRIVRKRGSAIAITPRSNEEFVASANQAIADWRRTGEATSL